MSGLGRGFWRNMDLKGRIDALEEAFDSHLVGIRERCREMGEVLAKSDLLSACKAMKKENEELHKANKSHTDAYVAHQKKLAVADQKFHLLLQEVGDLRGTLKVAVEALESHYSLVGSLNHTYPKKRRGESKQCDGLAKIRGGK